MADYINFLSVALQINMVSCYELKRVGTGSVGSGEKGDAQTANSFSFLSNMLVMSFFLISLQSKWKIKIVWHLPLFHLGLFKAEWEDKGVEGGVSWENVIQPQDSPSFTPTCLCFPFEGYVGRLYKHEKGFPLVFSNVSRRHQGSIE